MACNTTHSHVNKLSHFLRAHCPCSATHPILLQCVAVCCSVLQCVAVCCSVLQCVLQCAVDVAVCCEHVAGVPSDYACVCAGYVYEL